MRLTRVMRTAAWGLGGVATMALVAVTTVCATSGCATIGYYAQSVTGHLEILQAARPVPQWLADPATSEALKKRLVLSQQIRDFAVVGCVGYRGYYDRDNADGLAASLRGQGLDVAVYPVPAYSTLGRLPTGGWLADPLLNTFIGYPEGELARLIFHELAHQVAFAPGDTLFNESFASTVEQIGAERWLAANGSAEARSEYTQSLARRADFQELTNRYRDRFATLYASAASDADKREQKTALLLRLQADYATMKATRWAGYAGYDAWFARANNAAFGVLASYTSLVPAFERLFDRSRQDFATFYAEVRRLAALPPLQRRAALER